MNLKILLGLPKTLYINLHYFGVRRGLELPILVSNKTKLIKLNGKIILKEALRHGMVRIGIVGFDTTASEYTKLELNGVHFFSDRIIIGRGSIITINKYSNLTIDSNCMISRETKVISSNDISIGDDCVISWDSHGYGFPLYLR